MKDLYSRVLDASVVYKWFVKEIYQDMPHFVRQNPKS